MYPRIILLLYLMATLGYDYSHAQSCPHSFQLRSDIPSTCAEMSMTMLYDRVGRPYLYLANKSAGLKVFDLSDPSAPTLMNALDTGVFGGLDVMSITQQGDYLYLALGNHFTNPQQGGVAIVDVTSPTFPFVTDIYVVPGKPSGAGMTVASGNTIYLAAMQTGLVILDATNKQDIGHVSTFLPDLNYPEPNPDTPKYNVRGLEVRGDTAYLAFDAGGVRLVNVGVKELPVEYGRYSNSLLNGKPRAYNNVQVHDNYVYVTTDYCGLEVLRLVPQSNPVGVGWWNPYDCVNGNWFASPIHTNEIRFDSTCNKVFVSGGRTEVVVIDVSNPSMPDSCSAYGIAGDDIASWGIDVYDNQLAFSYVCALVPFTSFKTGFKLLEYAQCTTSGIEDPEPLAADPYQHSHDASVVTIYNILGEQMVATELLPNGVYFEVRNGTDRTPSGPSCATLNRGVVRMHVHGVDDVSYNLKHSQ